MAGIIDLTDTGEHDVLTSTESGGLLGGAYLDGQPLESYLEADEQPRYVLRNKKSGLRIETADGTRSVEPDDSYQTLGMVTDLRILFVAGKDGGDRTLSVDLSDIVEARVGSGRLRTSTLALETLSGETWLFPCRGDPSPVAAYIEAAAQTWANAGRLLDDLEAALSAAREQLDAGEYEAAAERIAGGDATIRTARDRIGELGAAASTRIDARAEELTERLVESRREIRAAEAADDHARAGEFWQAGEYEHAARAYETAIAGYQRALAIDGSEPADEKLRSRLRGAAGERELLRVGPLVDAETRRRRASALADPEAAATEWRAAHDAYHELLGLEWPDPDREFVADREHLRDRTAETADDAITNYWEAGRRWLGSGDKLAVQGRDQQATQVYERASGQFEQAHQLAREFRPERVEAIEAGIEAASRRLDGAVPRETVPDDPIGFDPAAGPEDADADPGDEDPDPLDGLSFHDSLDGRSVPAARNRELHSRRAASTHDERSERSVLDRIQAQKRTGVDDQFTAESPVDADRSEEQPPSPAERNAGSAPEETLERSLANLDRKRLAELVASVWQTEGWMTTVFTAANDTVYDVVAIRNDPDRRQLIWTEDGDGDIPETLFKQCETTLESSQADTAVIVATRPASTAAKHRAGKHDISLVGSAQFIGRVREAGLDARLVEMGEPDESPQA